jgi:hypothetical protein
VIPVQPGWVVVPAKQLTPNEWYHLLGWTKDREPVIAWSTGAHEWRSVAGEDPYCIATLEEWCGTRAQHKP